MLGIVLGEGKSSSSAKGSSSAARPFVIASIVIREPAAGLGVRVLNDDDIVAVVLTGKDLADQSATSLPGPTDPTGSTLH